MEVKYSSLKEINLCFLGCGKICAAHAKRLQRLFPNINLYFASRNVEKSKSYSQRFNGKGYFENYESAISSEKINVIFITATPDTHFDLAMKAASSSKNIIVEKPPFFTVDEMHQVGRLADANEVMLLIAENYYYKPLRHKLKEFIQSGIIGRPLFININAMKKQKIENDWRNDKSIVGFGALFEGGIHWVNIINNIGFEFKDVNGFFPDSQRDSLERSVQVIAKTFNGTLINLFYSWEVDTVFKGLRLSKIFGTEGSITFESNGVFIFVRGKKLSFKMPIKNITGFDPMLKDFINALHNGKQPELTWRMAIKDLEMIERIYKSKKGEN